MKCSSCGKELTKKTIRKRIVNISPTQRIFINTGPTQRKVSLEAVVKALGAQKINFGTLCSKCTRKFLLRNRIHPKT